MSDTYEKTDQGPGKLFCFGLGYTGLALAKALIADGWQVAGTSRTAESASFLTEQGIEAFVFDRTRPLADAGSALKGVTHLLSSVPPDETGDPVLDCHADDLEALAQNTAWAGYLSTTVVYGNRDGGWVDESSARTPGVARGQRRVDAEDRWIALGQASNIPVHLFRLAGIYGPGRSAFDQIRAGREKRVERPGQVFSRIHVEDIVAVLRASMQQPRAGAAYNLCDDNAAAPADVTAFACELMGVPVPPAVQYEDADLSDMAKTFWADNKRVRNNLLQQELGVTLKYPDYQSGLRAILAAEQAG
ncbi:MAG: SDR family oxidoreductase [Alphaproteobacteria bacterium]|mgnify:FL=1|jgi:nucleoside-diphosphate-sugar epimerase|nr:SDR family oxidoreductase [Alphaproteobacteria bacterium]MBT4085081.1 SDR family oxidoreductase [Alphaproteobacteria bacterium]MBT4546096.1 SDR family oxidoreductase [Alphaproteobacteria bacterium]MBT7744356.1 SDR family oxidoreductase [Alphaproteobacteria bacterium]